MDTKKALGMPVVIGILAVVVIVLGVVGYKMLIVPPETGHAVSPAGYGQSSGGTAAAAKP